MVLDLSLDLLQIMHHLYRRFRLRLKQHGRRSFPTTLDR